MRFLFLLVAGAFLPLTTLAQGTVRGKVTDTRGETLIGATVVLKSDPGTGTVTDLDGNYSLAIKSDAPTVVVFSFVGFESKEMTVNPQGGAVQVVNVMLGDKAIELGAVEIEAKARRDGDAYLDRMRINSAANLDFVSREVMLKTGDNDAQQAVRRVTGVSTIGPFVSVRGLADRYLVTTVNGGRLPTLDPFTNNLRLDLFPTGLMDNIVITKTATPDLPGDWSGALLSMNTSDYPEKLRVSVGMNIGFNPNATFKDIYTTAPSSTDIWARDDGTRGIPEGVPLSSEDYPGFIEPNLYEQLTYLGLGSVLNNYGITANTPGFQGTVMGTGNVLQHVMLTHLGLLPPALISNPGAVQTAVNAYNSTYNLPYFSPHFNGQLEAYNLAFDNSRWRLVQRQASPNLGQFITIGNQVPLFKRSKSPKTLGFLVGLRYNTETEYDPGSVFQRTGEAYDDPTPGDAFGTEGEQAISVVTHGWNALANLALKLDRNNSFALMVMPNAIAHNNARFRRFFSPGLAADRLASEDQFYEQRMMWVYQFGSKHFVPALNTKVEFDASYSDGQRDMLDFKQIGYVLPPPGAPITTVEADLGVPGRIWRFLDERLLDARLSVELPLTDDPRTPGKLRFGGAYLFNERLNRQVYYQVQGAPGPAQWEDASRFMLGPNGRFRSQYKAFGTFKDDDIGIKHIMAVFGMLDLSITPRTRLVGGLRAEHTDLVTDILRFHREGVLPDDPSRGTVGDVSVGGGANPEPKPAVPGILDQWDLLPSVNLIHKLRDDPETPMNLRLAWFRSLARPSFREFAVTQQIDYLLNSFVYGNPDLKMTLVDNADLRLERFFSRRTNASLSVFHKRFTNHIELVYTAAGGFTWRNAQFSQVTGVELEGRVGITRWLEWRGNLTLMQSRSELETTLLQPPVRYSTPMYGQAPYLVNSTLSWTADSARFSLSASYNVQGPKLAISNSEVNPYGIRAYEMPRHMVDIVATKRLGKHWGVRAMVRNLLNSPYRRTYRFAVGYAYDFDSYAWGAEYALGFTYTIQ